MKAILIILLFGVFAHAQAVRSLLEEGRYQQDVLGDFQQAYKNYKDAIHSSHQSDELMVQIYVRAIECALALEEKEDATMLYEELESKYADNKTELLKRSQFSKVLDFKAIVIKELLRRSSLEKKSGINAALAEKNSLEAWQRFNQREFIAAEELFRRALDANPYHDNAWNGLGWCYFNTANLEIAVTSFEKSIELNAENVGALNGMGWCSKQQGDSEQALSFWKRTVGISPYATAALSGLVSTYMEKANYDQAARYAAQWVEADPSDAHAATALKKAQRRGGETPEDTESFDFLQAAPWGDFDQQLYTIVDAAGKTMGSGIITISGTEKEWKFDERYSLANIDQVIYYSAISSKKTFLPSSGESAVGSTLKALIYSKIGGKCVAQPEGKSDNHQITLSQPTIDGAQIMSLLRRLPLQKGFSVSVDFCLPQLGLATAKIKVDEQVKIESPAGDFLTYPVLLQNFINGQKIQTMEVWVEAALPHRLIKVDSGSWGMEFIKSVTEAAESISSHQSEVCDTKVSVPDGWYVGLDAQTGYSQQVSLLSPQMKVKAYLLSSPNNKESAQTVFKNDYKILQKTFPEYKIKKGTKSSFKHGNYEAISYVAEYKWEGQNIAERRCYFVKEDMCHWFVFRTPTVQYDQVKEDIETIIKAFHAE
ncbi:MAG: tetratricopeptide repeat protein [Akkermansiaceae bacterium]